MLAAIGSALLFTVVMALLSPLAFLLFSKRVSQWAERRDGDRAAERSGAAELGLFLGYLLGAFITAFCLTYFK